MSDFYGLGKFYSKEEMEKAEKELGKKGIPQKKYPEIRTFPENVRIDEYGKVYFE